MKGPKRPARAQRPRRLKSRPAKPRTTSRRPSPPPPYILRDVEAHARANPGFEIPPPEARAHVHPGDVVKLVFANIGERMWVEVHDRAVHRGKGVAYSGVLKSKPVNASAGLDVGSVIAFGPNHIADIDSLEVINGGDGDEACDHDHDVPDVDQVCKLATALGAASESARQNVKLALEILRTTLPDSSDELLDVRTHAAEVASRNMRSLTCLSGETLRLFGHHGHDVDEDEASVAVDPSKNN